MITQPDIKFFGAVTVSDRGQIVIPAQARRDLGIAIGDKLLVIGGPRGGLVLIPASALGEMISKWTDFAQKISAQGLGIEQAMEEVNEKEA